MSTYVIRCHSKDPSTKRCPNCDSIDLDMYTDTDGICNNCGAGIEVEYTNKPTPKVKEDESLETVVYIAEYSKDDFVRNAYIDLATDKRTPADVLDSEFCVLR